MVSLRDVCLEDSSDCFPVGSEEDWGDGTLIGPKSCIEGLEVGWPEG